VGVGWDERRNRRVLEKMEQTMRALEIGLQIGVGWRDNEQEV
jgi:hypothetical protein